MGQLKDTFETGLAIGSDKSKSPAEVFTELTDIAKRKIMVSMRMKKVREESGLTQKEVAEKLGISQSYISRIEKKVIKRLRTVVSNF